MYFAFAPKRKVKQVQALVFSDSTFYHKYSDYLEFPELFPQIKDISFVEAQLDVVASDSIWILVNAVEKTISLRLKGVDLRKISVPTMKIDPFFNSLDPVSYRKIFSNPLKIVSDQSTILKDPITIQKAPKDTVEALAQLALPDSIKFDPAFITFNLDYGFRLVFEQMEAESENDKALKKQFEKDLYDEKIRTNLLGIIKKDVKYIPTIVIELPVDEIHAFYRAIPVNGNIVFTF